MDRYKLICKAENEILLRELFRANHIILDDQNASITLCEQGLTCSQDNDLIIMFRPDKITTLLALIKEEKYQPLSLIMGKSDENYIPIEADSVVYFSAYGNDTYANTADGKRFRIKNKLYELENELSSKKFIRVNKSEIVNIRYVLQITPMFKGRLLLKLQGFKEMSEVSRNYIKNFKERIGM